MVLLKSILLLMLSEGEVGLGEIEPPSAEPFTEAVDDDGSAPLVSPATTLKDYLAFCKRRM